MGCSGRCTQEGSGRQSTIYGVRGHSRAHYGTLATKRTTLAPHGRKPHKPAIPPPSPTPCSRPCQAYRPRSRPSTTPLPRYHPSKEPPPPPRCTGVSSSNRPLHHIKGSFLTLRRLSSTFRRLQRSLVSSCRASRHLPQQPLSIRSVEISEEGPREPLASHARSPDSQTMGGTMPSFVTGSHGARAAVGSLFVRLTRQSETEQTTARV